MICLSCKKQIPDDSAKCPECGAEVFHKEQVKKEIIFRRYQRWFFYGVLILVFSGLVGVIVKIQLNNSDLLLNMSVAQRTLEGKSAELELAKTELEQTAADLEKTRAELGGQKEKLSGDLTLAEAELAKKIDELSKAVEEKLQAIVKYERVNSAFLNISEAAAGISNGDLNKIPVADVWPVGTDTDSDGIPDEAESSLGTSATSSDTDADGYSDKDELLRGFNPLGAGNLPIDQGFADKQKGRVFKQSWGGGYLWYVSQAGKRYFLSPIQQPEQAAPAVAPIASTTPAAVNFASSSTSTIPPPPPKPVEPNNAPAAPVANDFDNANPANAGNKIDKVSPAIPPIPDITPATPKATTSNPGMPR